MMYRAYQGGKCGGRDVSKGREYGQLKEEAGFEEYGGMLAEFAAFRNGGIDYSTAGLIRSCPSYRPYLGKELIRGRG